jgi:FkbM family methyltransferase
MKSSAAGKIIYSEGIAFDASERRVKVRAQSLMTKEPDTIFWLKNYVNAQETLFDIGANIGIFSLYAAKHRGARVYAFEPESSNYYLLNKHIYLNGLDEKIQAYNIALNDTNTLSSLNLRKWEPGGSINNFGEARDHFHEAFSPVFKQGVIGLSLDSLISNFELPAPHHIKIDVDGNELQILKGMRETLKNPVLKTIAVEVNVNLADTGDMHDLLIDGGFRQLETPQLINQKYLDKGFLNRFYARG